MNLKNIEREVAQKNKYYMITFIYLFALDYLFIWEREKESMHARVEGRADGQGQNPKETTPWAGSLTQGWIPRPWDHELSPNQVRHLTDCATQVPLHDYTYKRD